MWRNTVGLTLFGEQSSPESGEQIDSCFALYRNLKEFMLRIRQSILQTQVL